MNTGKNKKKNRPNKPQSQPAQNPDSEKGENVTEKSENVSKAEERVPEIVSEVVVPPVAEKENTGNEGPKKPKRNRGKKKGDKEDSSEIPVETVSLSEDIKTDNVQKDIIKPDKSTVTDTKIDATNQPVEPTARKKKGKNKNQETTKIDETEKSTELEINPSDKPKTDIKESELLEGEIKPAKKKNKKNKKHRNDSERSDKADELTCTSAFEMILQTKTESEQKQEEVNKDDVKSVAVSDSSISEPTVKEVKKAIAENLSVDTAVPDANKNIIKESAIEDTSNDNVPKNKKKNKKDKKHFSSSDENVQSNILPQKKIIKSEENEQKGISDSDAKSIHKCEMKEMPESDILPVTEILPLKESTVSEESDAKCKAKIAKPVEKKNKNKSIEIESKQESPKMAESKKDEAYQLSELDKEYSKIDVFSCDVPKVTETITEIKTDVQTTLPTSIAEDKPESAENKSEELEGDSVSTDSFEVVKHPKKKGKGKNNTFNIDDKAMTPEKTDIIISDTEKKREKQFDVARPPFDITKPFETLETSLNIIEEVPELTTSKNLSETALKSEENKNISPIITEIKQSEEKKATEVMSIPEDKSNKKRKKSPKPSKKQETFIIPEEKNSAVIEQKKETTKTASTEPPKILPESEMIESVMTQSGGSEITPDLIEHPRSTSADIIDSNNNNKTVIQEVNLPQTLHIPFVIPDTPYIQGSGETPSPIVIATCVPISEKELEERQKKVPKKTDLKSQVMEVNKDMEVLRRSIERSLAEFTALEKGEQEVEDKYAAQSLEMKQDKSKLTILDETIKEQAQVTGTTITEQDSVSPDNSTKKEESASTPEPPARKDNKGKSKSKKKGKQESQQQTTTATDTTTSTSVTEKKDTSSQESKKENKTEQKEDKSSTGQDKGKQQTQSLKNESDNTEQKSKDTQETDLHEFDPIVNFEDAMTSSSSVDDVNKSFEIIVNDGLNDSNTDETSNFRNNPEINVTAPDEHEKAKEEKQQKENPIVSQPKNLLGHPVIPARSNKTDYKKEKNKPPNTKLARVKIKDADEIDKGIKQSKESQTDNKPKILKDKSTNESVTCVTSENDEYVYKYSFRKVFLSSNCHVCKKELKESRVPCNFCYLTFYCSEKHKDDDYDQHQSLCFAISTIIRLKGLKHIYADSQGVTGHNYRLLRMQTIVSCEKILKRKLQPWEQEALLYPRVCADMGCREWRQGQLKDCELCGQISYCSEHPEHLPKSHARWCKSYSLYQKLVVYQLTRGRLDPRLPGRLMKGERIGDNINRLLADMYDEKIDMTDMQYAALTQLATAPLTAAHCYQLYSDKMKTVAVSNGNGVHKSPTFTIHVVGAELQFEADSLNKWETFFLHLRPDVATLRVVLVGPELNPSNLPVDLLGKIKLCPTCRVEKRRVVFHFHDRQFYHQYATSDDFTRPDIVCAFNPSINRSSSYDDTWSSTINCIFKLKVPFVITAYTMNEMLRDFTSIKTSSKVEFNTVSEAKFNPFASVRPDRNFISDDEMPLLFKNYCYMVLIGAF
ncbi:hypothetical protein JYU34_020712 [Plutella xylostella]|uniref:MYND-type domain-containing protein n=1 Tax=Plutella xylostella TaxID=51655 RepID=A0ABQ7PWG2_PLUXY|nr:hypothetical protein JYU34_020712 [Plutella xylostella]